MDIAIVENAILEQDDVLISLYHDFNIDAVCRICGLTPSNRNRSAERSCHAPTHQRCSCLD